MESKRSLIKSNILTFIGMIILPTLYELVAYSMLADSQVGSYISLGIILLLGIIAAVIGVNIEKMIPKERFVSGLIWIGIGLIIIGLSMSKVLKVELGYFMGLFNNILFQLILIGTWLVGIFKRKRVNTIKYEIK